MIIDLVGEKSIGKTLIAKELSRLIPNCVNIDEDEVRGLYNYLDSTQTGIRIITQDCYNIAKFLESKGITTVLSLNCPIIDRGDLKLKNKKVHECYLYNKDFNSEYSDSDMSIDISEQKWNVYANDIFLKIRN